MAESAISSSEVEKLYEYGQRLSEAKDKSLADYRGIIEAAGGSVKAKQLAAQLIPKFFKYFPTLSPLAMDQHFNLCEDYELAVRVQAIRGLPLFCKDTPEYLSKIVDVLVQLLPAGENVERDAAQKALMTLLQQDVKTSLTVLFKHIGTSEETSSDEIIREKVLCFIRDKVFPLKAELLKPQELMERVITDLVKNSLQGATGAELNMFMDFLQGLSLFGQDASAERIQELVEIIEGQANLNSQLDVADGDYVERLISYLHMSIPLYMRGASSNKLITYLNKHIIPVFDSLSDKWKDSLLKNLADFSHYATPQDCRQLLPSVFQLLKKHMIRRKVEDMKFTFLECLFFIFHHLAYKTPNATNSLCGYKIVTGQPSDRLGEDFSQHYKDFTERLGTIEDLARIMIKKVTQRMTDNSKAMSAAKTDEEKNVIKTQKQNAIALLRSCNNILAMTQPLHSKSPSFIGDQRINLSWKETVKPLAPSHAPVIGQKRVAAANNPSDLRNKKGRGGGIFTQNQHINKAFEGLNGGGRGRGGGRYRRGRGRGRSYTYRY